MANIATKFVPIKGTQAAIDDIEIRNGNFYVTTDTGRIYVDTANERILLGNGGVSVHYANVEPVQQNTPTGVIIYLLSRSQIEDENTLKENDLILNKFDGCFYQVTEFNAVSVTTIRLAVSGSGGGGGGDSYSGSMILKPIGLTSLEILDSQNCIIQYNFTAVDSSNNPTGNGEGVLYVNGVKKSTFIVRQGDNSLDVTKYIEINQENNTVRLEVTGDIGTVNKPTRQITWSIGVVHLTAEWNYIDNTLNTGNTFQVNWTIKGNHAHQTYIVIDDAYTVTPPAPQENYSLEQHYAINCSEYGLNHGAHKVELYATTKLNGLTVRTNSVYHTVMMIETGNTIPIVALNYYATTMNQYDTINIPILACNPNSFSTITVILRDNGEEVGRFENIENNSVTTWSYTALTAGPHRLLAALDSSMSYINIEVEELNINATGKEIQDYDFKFAANEMLNNTTIKNWNSGNQHDVHFTFSENFDWVNGGLHQELDDNGNPRSYFCIKAGDYVTLNYKLFNHLQPSRGQVFKCIFKVTNSRNYDAEFLNCYDDNNNIGLKMRAQDTLYANSLNNITIPYCENTLIEFEYDVWGIESMYGGHRYIIPWMDGVPCGIKVYDINTIFSQNQDIVIGSEECDVQIYLLKVYNRHLSDNEHLANFIADASNAQEMLSRYNRNNILDDNTGDISISKLALANPNMKIYAYDIPRMSTTKKDKVNGCTYAQYQNSTIPEVTASNVTIAVQGTSSSKYGEAAFNLDSEFNDGFDLADGSHVDKYAMTEDSIPVNYFNTKVNVASCEGANNALNQRWYNQFQPFICEHRFKHSNARDTMDFPYPGVIFLKDENQITDSDGHTGDNVFKDTDRYLQSPYYKMYSICNMGNSKKNKDVFHDKKNLYESCVEVTDNQSLPQWMTSLEHVNRDDIEASETGEPYYELTQDITINNTKTYYTFDGSDYQQVNEPDVNNIGTYYEFITPVYGPYFEFRYVPTIKDNDGEEDVAATNALKQTHSNAWYDFVNWFVHLDPCPYDPKNHPYGYTGEPLAEPETYGAYTFKGYKSSVTNYEPADQILRGTTISTFQGTYTEDTYKRRMAKLLSECEDHLVMDAVVFHYLMIERHCMIDNVAKNTFWTTEDMVHWSMIKDYDNDTSDGNDNEGKLTLTYGLEVLDKLNSTKDVFNATPSVWLHFIDGLYTARQTVYQALDSKGAWNPRTYLRMFEEFQSAIPERCWIEDYYRKYIRPLEVYNNGMFLGMLEGGKKTHQRKQFETYQALYMSSEYFGNDCHENSMVCRGESAGVEIKFNIKMYIDCYVHFDAGQQYLYGDKHQGVRTKRNTMLTFKCPVQNTNDATMNFYLASYITYLGGLSSCVPKEINIAKAIRLREFYLGGEKYQKTDDQVINNNRTYYILNNGEYEAVPQADLNVEDLNLYYVSVVNHNLQKIDLGANAMLEIMDLRNLAADTEALNLSELLALQTLDTTGSSITGVTIADNAPIETLTLNDINTLRLKNLYQLSNLTLSSYDNLKTVLLDNIDNSSINSKDIINNATELENYYLKNVQWDIDNNNELQSPADAIKILNRLADADMHPLVLDAHGSPTTGSRAESLSGTLTLSAGNFSNEDVLDIYNYYTVDSATNFPALDLVFSGNNARMYAVNVYHGNGSLVWTRKTGSTTLDSSFFTTGPMGALNISNIESYPDNQYNYTFDNQWAVYNADSNSNEPIAIISNELPIYNENVSSNLKIVPLYTKEAILYDVVFYTPNNDPVYCEATYGTTLAQVIADNNIATPEADAAASANLPMTQVYVFRGYSLVEQGGNILNNEIYTISGDISLYAQFTTQSVYDNVHLEWFNFEAGSYVDETTPEYSVQDGYIINPKPGVILSGKITLPIQYNNKPVYAIGALFGQTDVNDTVSDSIHKNITHIFFEAETNTKQKQVRVISDCAFRYVRSLKYFDFSGIRIIGSRAFQRTVLQPTLVGTEAHYIFGDVLYRIGELGLNNAVQNNTNTDKCVVTLPGTLKYIANQGIAANSFSSIAPIYFIIGSSTEMSELILDNTVSAAMINLENKIYLLQFYTRQYTVEDVESSKLFNPDMRDVWPDIILIETS